jgi:predicted alpha/beta superfamily hydrolase
MPVCSRRNAVSKPQLEAARHELSAIMPKTEYFEIDSAVAGARYGVWVAVPWGYDFEPERRFPAIFTPDGNLAAPALIPIGVDLHNAPTQPFIQVSVGYCGNEVADWLFAHRNRDLLPPGEPPAGSHLASIDASIAAGGEPAEWGRKFRDAIMNGGRADLYLRFLVEELYPLVAERWRVDTTTCGLFGHSYGGLFAAWAAMQRPAVFPRIGCSSPGLSSDRSKVFELLEQEVASEADHTGRQLHLSIGEWEITQKSTYQMLGATFGKLTYMLGDRPLKGLKVTSKIIADATHGMSLPAQFCSFVRACYSVE